MIKNLYKGQYFAADQVDEALDVYMTDDMEGGVFSRSEVTELIDELKEIRKLDKKNRKKK